MKAKFFLLATASVAYMMSSGFCGATPPGEGGAAAQEESGAAAAAAAEPADKDQSSDSGVRKPNLEDQKARLMRVIAVGRQLGILRLPFFPTKKVVSSLGLENLEPTFTQLVLPGKMTNEEQQLGLGILMKYFPNITTILPTKYIDKKLFASIGKGIVFLDYLQELTSLDLTNAPDVSEKSIQVVVNKLPKLESLNVQNNTLSFNFLEELVGKPSLAVLTFSEKGLTKDQLEELKKDWHEAKKVPTNLKIVGEPAQ